MSKEELQTYVTIINGYKYIVMENGAIVPLLRVNEIDTSIGRVSNVILRNWADFDSLEPRIGNKIKLVFNNFGQKEVIKIDNDFSTEPINKPTVCPLCGEPLNMSDTEANAPVIRCLNDNCQYFAIISILRYLRFCSLVTELSYIDISILFTNHVVTNILDLYKLKVNDLEKIGFTTEASRNIVNKIRNNVRIPLQNIIYSILPKSKPSEAIKLASLYNEISWIAAMTVIEPTTYISKRESGDSKLTKLVLSYNKELAANEKMFKALTDIVTAIRLPKKLPMTNKLFIIGNITTLTKQHLETVIRLNGGKTEDNFNTLVWSAVDYIVSSGIESNQKVIEGINSDILTITEDELRCLLDVKYANEPDAEYMNKIKQSIGLVVDDDPR
nr:MAG TPA: DNA ligase [Caudoviricetes sp.]